MIALVEQKKNEVAALCKKFKVHRLDLFGSATKKSFRPDSSDLDFLVSFDEKEPAEYSRCYFDLADSLEKLFQRHVDLVTERSVRNPYFRQSIDETRETVYAA